LLLDVPASKENLYIIAAGFTSQMPLLSAIQQCQGAEGTLKHGPHHSNQGKPLAASFHDPLTDISESGMHE